jgi:radical SAM superfamily enzyme
LTKIEGLQKRVNRMRESTPPPPSREDIVSEFINGLPWELRSQILEYVKGRIHELELEGETKTS